MFKRSIFAHVRMKSQEGLNRSTMIKKRIAERTEIAKGRYAGALIKISSMNLQPLLISARF